MPRDGIRCRAMRSNGSVLLALMVISAIVAVLGTSMLTVGYHAQVRAVRVAEDMAARVAADAGLARAMHTLKSQFLAGALDPQALPSETAAAIANFEGTFTYAITTGPSGGYTVTSTGDFHGAQRTVEAVMKGGGMVHECALFALESLVLHNSARIDWYNYSSGDVPLKTGTRSTSKAAIVMHNSSYINGDVVVGAGGDPGDVIDGSGTYTGSAYAESVNHETPAVSVPAGLVSSPSGNAIDRNQTISTSGKYSKIDLGNSEILTINGHVELYITGNVALGNSAEIRVNEGCSLVLYVDGTIVGKNSSKFNNKTRDAKCLKLLGTGSCSQITLNNSGDMYAIVYAPSANLVVHNSATVRGSVTVRACELKNSAVMYYDASLREHQDPAFAGSLELASWREY